MNSYIGIEIGNSARTEFLMKSGNYEHTEDGIYLGQVQAKNEMEAYEKIQKLEWNKDRIFGNITIKQVIG